MKEEDSASSVLFRLDSHAHLYPCFEPTTWLTHLAQNLNVVSPLNKCIGGAVLTEGEQDRGSFDRLISTLERERPVEGDRRFRVEVGSEWVKIEVTGDAVDAVPRPPLFLFPGVQVVSLEGIEVLFLFTAQRLSEKLSLVELIQYGVGEELIVVLPWSPGKW